MPDFDENDRSTWPAAWWQYIRMPEIQQITGLSKDTIVRNHSDKLKQLSDRCIGMRRGEAITIGTRKADG